MLLYPLFGYRFIRLSGPIMFTLTPHYFRHNYVTMLYEAGVDPLIAMKIVGHTDYQTTANIYTHVRDELLKKSTVNMGDVFRKREETMTTRKTGGHGFPKTEPGNCTETIREHRQIAEKRTITNRAGQEVACGFCLERYGVSDYNLRIV